ncbi:ATP-binding protein [Oculatella sp. LEGE 06141]|uniref:ATP-binding protein n=2 Tax=Oculatella sp. LEGE 06141 TaxID=1828648 RepID=UPI00187EFDBC|nr:ATP-binding protein [Oculatella sp. LEGE 06141]MBE9178633.1 ATP-binding protein [Oculatella sp. LEGE 06141]
MESAKLTDEQWIEHAYLKAAKGTHTGLIGVSGIVAGVALAAVTGTGFAFLPPAIIGIHTAWRRNKEMSESQTAIQQYGCVAHELEGHSLGEYCEQYGDETAIAQLIWAEKKGLRLSPDAEALLNLWRQRQEKPKPQRKESLNKLLEPATLTPSAFTNQAVGSESEERSIDLPANDEPDDSDEQRSMEPDLSNPDPRARMVDLLTVLGRDGFPLGSLIHHPFVWFYGASQSGKTTAALMLAIARLALDHQVGYFSTDDDYPKRIAWSEVASNFRAYSQGVDRMTRAIESASKHSLKHQSVIFDEMLAAASQYEIDLQKLLTAVLMKGPKSGIGFIGISQNDTSGAHGLKGMDATWRSGRVGIFAVHTEDEMGERSPTGKYLIDRNGREDRWELPSWILTETNEYGHPDPVVWMLTRFPELTSSNGSRQTPDRDGQNPDKTGTSAGQNPDNPHGLVDKPVLGLIQELGQNWAGLSERSFLGLFLTLSKGMGRTRFIEQHMGVTSGRKRQEISKYIDSLLAKFQVEETR